MDMGRREQKRANAPFLAALSEAPWNRAKPGNGEPHTSPPFIAFAKITGVRRCIYPKFIYFPGTSPGSDVEYGSEPLPPVFVLCVVGIARFMVLWLGRG